MNNEIVLKGIGLFKNYMPDKKEQLNVVLDGEKSLSEILEDINMDNKIIYIALLNGKKVDADYKPKNGDIISLMLPIYGG